MKSFKRIRANWCSDSGLENVYPRGRADEAAWIWSSERGPGEESFIWFRLSFPWHGGALRFHVSADQRFALWIDGEFLSRGPEGGPPHRWPFASYEVPLDAESHRIEALVWWAHSTEAPPAPGHRNTTASAPLARMSWRGGFLLAAASECDAHLIDTGRAAWESAPANGWEFLSASSNQGTSAEDTCLTVGAEMAVDVFSFTKEQSWSPAKLVRHPVSPNPYGLVMPGWCLVPCPLPDQEDEPFCKISGGFRVRTLLKESPDPHPRGTPLLIEDAEGEPEISHWGGNVHWTLGPGEGSAMLLDAEEYLTGYVTMEAVGDLEIEALWAESLYDNKHLNAKGDRDQVAGKWFRGFGDRFIFRGSDPLSIQGHWWRAGRYLLLVARNTGSREATLLSFDVRRTRYPLASIGSFEGERKHEQIFALCERGLRATLHDMPCDSPFYEQQCYVADARIELLVAGYLASDANYSRWVIETINASRNAEGWTAMRFPSSERQESGTFAMQWIWMLHDHWMLYGDRMFVQTMVPAVESLLRACERTLGENGLIARLPGWPFVDWVPAWDSGAPPGGRDGLNASVNLMLLLTLQLAATILKQADRPSSAARQLAGRLKTAIRGTFFEPKASWLHETPSLPEPSWHAQTLGVLTGLLSRKEGRMTLLCAVEDPACMHHPDFPTYFFRHYLFEALVRLGAPDHILPLLDPWVEMRARGLLCTPESPEPSRSDCHAWASHPAYHLLASIAGIRPADPGFREITIRPSASFSNGATATVATPLGPCRLGVTGSGAERKFSVELPEKAVADLHAPQGRLRISS